MKKTLCGQWQFRRAGDEAWLNATVPGCNYLDLIENNKIPDPFYKCNEKDVYWVGKTDWEYKKEFEISEEDLSADKILLCFDMLDTVCDIFVNGSLAAKCCNCHIGHKFDVTEKLKAGQNEIKIYFYSPVKYVENIYKKEGAPVNSNGQNGIVHIRKPQCHFGWDWGPVLPPSGIGRDAYLEFIEAAKLTDFTVTQKHEGGHVNISVSAKTEIYGKNEPECEITLTYPNGEDYTADTASAEFTVNNPLLWWTYELSGKDTQPLYEVKVTLKLNGKVIDEKTKKIGLRTIELDRSNDIHGQNFRFILNGVPIFAKGANYIPADSFITAFDKARLEKLIEAARFSNMNMLRVWGGGYYESDEFYDICDEKGILVWQDFCFACQAYPFFKDSFLENVKAEVAYNVARLNHHASLAIWCGNNEIEQMQSAWLHMQKYIEWTVTFFYNILEKEVRKIDTATPFIPGSPCGVAPNVGISSDNVGDSHLWAVWHGLRMPSYYRTRYVRFCSEFGFESFPDTKTIDKFAEKSDYALNSAVFSSHQKCDSGNDKIMYYTAKRFNLPEKFEDLIYLSQLTQQDCVGDGVEHWRRNRGRCNGAMYWQFNDCWPCASWSSYDYYGGYKALQYAARRFNAPLCVSFEDTDETVKLFILNDLKATKKVLVRYKLFDFVTGVISEDEITTLAPALNRVETYVFKVPQLKNKFDLTRTGILAELYESDKIISRKTLLFGFEKTLSLPKAKLKLNTVINGSSIDITVSADKFARCVKLDTPLTFEHFSDNYFDVLPGESITVSLPVPEDIAANELADSISAISVSDIKFKPETIEDKLQQLAVVLKPANAANAFYHSRKPADVVVK